MNAHTVSVKAGFVSESSQTVMTMVTLVSVVQSQMSLQLHNPMTKII